MSTAVLEEMHTNLYPAQMLFARDELSNACRTPSSHVPTTPTTSTSPSNGYVCAASSPTSHAYGIPSDTNVPTFLCSGLLYVPSGPGISGHSPKTETSSS